MLGPENYIVIEHVLQVEQYQKWRILKSKQSNDNFYYRNIIKFNTCTKLLFRRKINKVN